MLPIDKRTRLLNGNTQRWRHSQSRSSTTPLFGRRRTVDKSLYNVKILKEDNKETKRASKYFSWGGRASGFSTARESDSYKSQDALVLFWWRYLCFCFETLLSMSFIFFQNCSDRSQRKHTRGRVYNIRPP